MEVKNVCVVGAGVMGRQIALNTAKYDYQVKVTDISADARKIAATWSEEYLAGRIAKGRMSEAQVDEIKSKFHVVDTLEEAARDADLVIEAIVEKEDKKRDFFRLVDTIVRKDTILATNSSYMVSSLFKDFVSNPGRLANLHYYNPALVMKLTEVVQGEHTSEDTVQILLDFSKNTGKTPVWVRKEIEGFIANRIIRAVNNEAMWLVEQGYCSYQDMDIACENGLGYPMGPFRLLDLTGVDLCYHIKKNNYDKTGVKSPLYDLIEDMYKQGQWGRKTGKGFYDYANK